MAILTIQPSIFVLKIAPGGTSQSVSKVAKKITHPVVLKRFWHRKYQQLNRLVCLVVLVAGEPPVLAGGVGDLCSGQSAVGNSRLANMDVLSVS
jgi:hypothetical protein